MSLLFFQLIARLLRERPSYILIQNPPSFPTLTATWLAAMWLRARWVVDWHNYGYTMLALRLPATHFAVRLAAWYEFRAGRMADHHLCVSQAMREDLAGRAGIEARVLYDRPLAFEERIPREDGTFVVVCASGWAADEDMGLLFDALESLPAGKMEMYLLGDGPLRESFQPRIDALCAAGWKIVTGYLTAVSYRACVRRADLGLSLHHSSSGVDLPMKVADLFAARVPVCAWDYGGSLSEQVVDGKTGFVFHTARDLIAILTRLLEDRTPLATMGMNIEREWRETWDQAWQGTAAQLFAEAGDDR